MTSPIYGFMVSTKPVEEFFDYILLHQINHVELDLRKKHSLLETFLPERIRNIRSFCERHHITLSLHPPYNLNLCSPMPLVRLRHSHYLKKCILLAAQLGANYLTLHLGNFYRYAIWANPREHALARLLKLLNSLLPTCKAHGITLALENMIPIPPEAGYSFLGDNIKDFQYIFVSLPSQHIKVCLDTGHANTAEGILEYVNQLGNKTIAVHFHDNKGQYDDHLNVGEGTVPWQQLMRNLKNIDFKGPFISECFKSQPHEAIQKLKSYL